MTGGQAVVHTGFGTGGVVRSEVPTVARFSPSHLLLAEAARMAVADGVRVIELGRGDEPYKFVLGAQPRYLRDVLLAPQMSPVP